MCLWALKLCSWGYNQPFFLCAGPFNTFALFQLLPHVLWPEYFPWWIPKAVPILILHQFYGSLGSCVQFCPGLGSAGSTLMLLHVSLGCLSSSAPLLQLLFESNKQCHCLSLLAAAAQPKSSLAEMSPTISHHLLGKPSSLPLCPML